MLEEVVQPFNLNEAYKRVVRNGGSCGADRMEVGELLPFLKANGKDLVRKILDGRYKPLPVRRVEIPKDNGKMRQLGIPTVVDRMVQQALAQILSPVYERQFVETSYGFRPGRGAHDALRKCGEYLNGGYVWTVDMDLEKFFDTVNQSKLLEILSRTIKDGRVVSLISKYLNAGAMKGGMFEKTEVGVPQGGPLSPLLANIMLNELDHELGRRGHKFVRYADDMVIFCRSKASAQQALEHITPYIEGRLFLKVNREKTVVAYASKIKFLGYGFYKGSQGFRMRVHKKSVKKMEDKVRELTDRRHLETKEKWTQKLKRYVTGWVNYFKLADMKTLLQRTDEWLRRRIRLVFWKRWKKTRTKYVNLRKLGLGHDDALKMANTRKGLWHTVLSPEIHRAISNARLVKTGFTFFSTYYQSVLTVN